jgi:hypothetical protein
LGDSAVGDRGIEAVLSNALSLLDVEQDGENSTGLAVGSLKKNCVSVASGFQ